MDMGLLILRVAFGLLLAGHGVQKLFGWFGGHGIAGTASFFHSLGFRPGRPMAVVAGTSEVTGGLLLALGFLSPLAGAVVVGTLLVAGSVHVANGVWNTKGGYETALLYGLVGAALAVTGPGAVSLDRLFGLDDNWSTGLGVAAIAVGLVSGAAVVARARLALRRETEATAPSPEAARPTAAA